MVFNSFVFLKPKTLDFNFFVYMKITSTVWNTFFLHNCCLWDSNIMTLHIGMANFWKRFFNFDFIFLSFNHNFFFKYSPEKKNSE